MKGIVELARKYAVGGIVKERVEDQSEVIEGMLENYESRPTINAIQKEIKKAEGLASTSRNALGFLNNVFPHLKELANELGENHTQVLNLNSFVAHVAQQMCVADINQEQKSAAVLRRDFSILKVKVDTAWSVTEKLGELNLLPEMYTQFNANKNALSSMRSQLGSVYGSTHGETEIPWRLIIGGIALLIFLINKCN